MTVKPSLVRRASFSRLECAPARLAPASIVLQNISPAKQRSAKRRFHSETFFVTTHQPPADRRLLKSVLLSALVLAAGAAGSYGLAQLRKPPELKAASNRQYNVETFTVQPVDLGEIVNAFGTARPEKEVVLSAQVAGEVSQILPQLKVGLKVKGPRSADPSLALQASIEDSRVENPDGDLLVRIDPSSYEERVAAARHRLSADQSDLNRIEQEEANLARIYEKIVADWEDSEREYKKTAKLREQGINTESDLRRAQMELRQHEKAKVQSHNERDLLPLRREQTQRMIESHTTDLKLSTLDLARTFVRPPFDGVLSTVHVERGQYVRVGEPLVTITAVSEVEIPLAVTLDDYTKLLPDVLERRYPAVELAENETSKPRWTGHVVRVSPKADEQTRTATVFIRVENTTQVTPLLPGTFVHARVEGPVLKRILAVPRDAVSNGRIFVERDGKVTQQPVVVSRILNGMALITSGLAPSDRVVLTNLDVLFEGAAVTVSLERSLAEELARQRTRSARLVEPPPES